MTSWTASAACERALLELNLALADNAEAHQAAKASRPPRTKRRRTSSPTERSSALALAVMVSTTEDYCQHAISELVERGLGSNHVGSLLWDDAVQSKFTSWDGQLRVWSLLGVDVGKSAEWKAFEPFTHVRNAAVHGLGELTRVQQRSPKALSAIQATGIAVVGTRLTIDEAALKDCRDAAAAFIRWLDHSFFHLSAGP